MTTRSRRHTAAGAALSRRAVLAAGVALVSATAGCARFFDDSDTDTADDLVADAPADSTVLTHLDTSAIAAADDAQQVLDDLAAVDPDHVDGVMAAIDAQTGLDPLTADEVLVFAVADAESDTTAILESDWTEAHVVESLEETTGHEYERVTDEDEPARYEPAQTPAADSSEATLEPSALGVYGDGRFIVGDADAVRASLAVHADDATAVSGPIRDAYDDARGAQIAVASESSGSPIPAEYAALVGLNTDIFDEVEAVGRSYTAVTAGVALEVRFHVGDERDATELETVLNGALPVLGELDAELEAAREDVIVSRNETVVEVTYEGDADAVFALLDEV